MYSIIICIRYVLKYSIHDSFSHLILSRAFLFVITEKVANIIENPSTVQQEVETTLKSLHERYAQLQQMIASRSRQQVPQNPIRGPASVALESQSRQNITVSSSLSEISPDRTFGSEELIALHVLRTSLKHPNSKCPYTNTVSSEDESTKIDDNDDS